MSKTPAQLGVYGALIGIAERLRQIQEEGYTANHDDQFTDGELVSAAIAYALATSKDAESRIKGMAENTEASAWWPHDWDTQAWKPKDTISNLRRAVAFLMAEIDRLLRAEEVDDAMAQDDSTHLPFLNEVDWHRAKAHVDQVQEQYIQLGATMPRVSVEFVLRHVIQPLQDRYDNGERTEELYKEMMAVE